jgi:hypothetical protein
LNFEGDVYPPKATLITVGFVVFKLRFGVLCPCGVHSNLVHRIERTKMVYNWLVILAVSWLAIFVGTHAKTTVVVDCGGQFGGFVTGTSCSTADAACKSIGHWSYRAIQGAGALRLGDSHGNPPSTFSSFVSCAFPSFFGSTITQASLKLTVSQIIGANPLNSSWTASGPATVNLAMVGDALPFLLPASFVSFYSSHPFVARAIDMVRSLTLFPMTCKPRLVYQTLEHARTRVWTAPHSLARCLLRPSPS